ncbi:hypothetical protein H0H87_003241 [Tephrocybe sp. NHM501043]|nr:hypothetical protein H0H87_003241 [Tephrocybe sp. NHM501043]
MRISVPGLPQAILSAAFSAKPVSPREATLRLAEFLGKGNTTVLTGAGVSVDSGIRAYRGSDGRYMNPNYKPIFYHELPMSTPELNFTDNVIGYPPVRDAQPNTTHFALAALLQASVVPHLITQRVHCKHRHSIDRESFQEWLSMANPEWKDFADDMERTFTQPRTNPDGDVGVLLVKFALLPDTKLSRLLLKAWGFLMTTMLYRIALSVSLKIE